MNNDPKFNDAIFLIGELHFENRALQNQYDLLLTKYNALGAEYDQQVAEISQLREEIRFLRREVPKEVAQ